MKAARWTLGMDFQGGSPEAESEFGTVFYPRQTKFVLATDYETLEAENVHLVGEVQRLEAALRSVLSTNWCTKEHDSATKDAVELLSQSTHSSAQVIDS